MTRPCPSKKAAPRRSLDASRRCVARACLRGIGGPPRQARLAARRLEHGPKVVPAEEDAARRGRPPEGRGRRACERHLLAVAGLVVARVDRELATPTSPVLGHARRPHRGGPWAGLEEHDEVRPHPDLGALLAGRGRSGSSVKSRRIGSTDGPVHVRGWAVVPSRPRGRGRDAGVGDDLVLREPPRERPPRGRLFDDRLARDDLAASLLVVADRSVGALSVGALRDVVLEVRPDVLPQGQAVGPRRASMAAGVEVVAPRGDELADRQRSAPGLRGRTSRPGDGTPRPGDGAGVARRGLLGRLRLIAFAGRDRVALAPPTPMNVRDAAGPTEGPASRCPRHGRG